MPNIIHLIRKIRSTGCDHKHALLLRGQDNFRNGLHQTQSVYPPSIEPFVSKEYWLTHLQNIHPRIASTNKPIFFSGLIRAARAFLIRSFLHVLPQ